MLTNLRLAAEECSVVSRQRLGNVLKRIAIALVAGAAVSTAAFASASALSVDGGTVQAGSSSVTCDTDGVKANWGLETDDSSVRSVRVTGVDPACAGATMFVKVDGGTTHSANITGTTVKVELPSPYPTAESIKNVKIWIEG